MRNAPDWHAWTQYLGIPYERMDCWALVAHVQRSLFGRKLPQLLDPDEIAPLRDLWAHDWVERGFAAFGRHFERIASIDSVAAGDIVLYKWGGVWHAGVLLDSEHLLHTTRRTGSRIARVRGQTLSRLRPQYILRLRECGEAPCGSSTTGSLSTRSGQVEPVGP